MAYRSYGTWHVANPLRSNYDICNSTSCQVNDTDTSIATDQAADATNGMVLSRDGQSVVARQGVFPLDAALAREGLARLGAAGATPPPSAR